MEIDLYSENNLRVLAQLLVKTWRPTEASEDQKAALSRAIFLAGNNRRGALLLCEVDALLREA